MNMGGSVRAISPLMSDEAAHEWGTRTAEVAYSTVTLFAKFLG